MGTIGIGLDDNRRAGLLAAIRRKRASVDGYLRTADTRRHRMLTTTIVAGALAATLTAAPALGGKSFSDWLTGLFGWEAPAWRMLCAAAALASLIATVTTQLMRAATSTSASRPRRRTAHGSRRSRPRSRAAS